MSTGWNQWYVRCPFFKNDDAKKRTIECEGVADGSSLKLCFQRKQDYMIHLETFCMRHFERCEVYHAAMEKYQD